MAANADIATIFLLLFVRLSSIAGHVATKWPANTFDRVRILHSSDACVHSRATQSVACLMRGSQVKTKFQSPAAHHFERNKFARSHLQCFALLCFLSSPVCCGRRARKSDLRYSFINTTIIELFDPKMADACLSCRMLSVAVTPIWRHHAVR